jgi:hypothetical protein
MFSRKDLDDISDIPLSYKIAEHVNFKLVAKCFYLLKIVSKNRNISIERAMIYSALL